MESAEHTTDCKEIFTQLSEYLDLELSPDACEKIAAHLAGCPPCIEFAESLRHTIELCRQYRPADLPKPIEKQARDHLLEVYRKALARLG